MSAYNIGISGTVPDVCWVRPGHPGQWELFCNSPHGYDVYAVTLDGGERLISSGEGPAHKTIALTLRDDETALTIRAR